MLLINKKETVGVNTDCLFFDLHFKWWSWTMSWIQGYKWSDHL